MNNKGQAVFFQFMIAIVIVVLLFGTANGVQTAVDNARSNLDCSNSSISQFDQGTCVIADLGIFYWIAGLLTLAGGVMVARRYI